VSEIAKDGDIETIVMLWSQLILKLSCTAEWLKNGYTCCLRASNEIDDGLHCEYVNLF